MGTTLTALAVRRRPGAVARCTSATRAPTCCARASSPRSRRDHTYVQTLIDAGRITPEEARSTRSAIVIRALDGIHPASPTSRCARRAPATATCLQRRPLRLRRRRAHCRAPRDLRPHRCGHRARRGRARGRRPRQRHGASSPTWSAATRRARPRHRSSWAPPVAAQPRAAARLRLPRRCAARSALGPRRQGVHQLRRRLGHGRLPRRSTPRSRARRGGGSAGGGRAAHRARGRGDGRRRAHLLLGLEPVLRRQRGRLRHDLPWAPRGLGADQPALGRAGQHLTVDSLPDFEARRSRRPSRRTRSRRRSRPCSA